MGVADGGFGTSWSWGGMGGTKTFIKCMGGNKSCQVYFGGYQIFWIISGGFRGMIAVSKHKSVFLNSQFLILNLRDVHK